jgi:hypothetical protein
MLIGRRQKEGHIDLEREWKTASERTNKGKIWNRVILSAASRELDDRVTIKHRIAGLYCEPLFAQLTQRLAPN